MSDFLAHSRSIVVGVLLNSTLMHSDPGLAEC